MLEMHCHGLDIVAAAGLSLTAVRSAGALLAFGGYNGKYHNSAQVYRPGEDMRPSIACLLGMR